MSVPPNELLLFGGAELRSRAANGSQLLAHPKITGLLACLAVGGPGRFHRRDRLVGLLWPEIDQAHARGALRKAVYVVRGALGEDAIRSRGDEEVAASADSLWCDVAEFTEAAESNRLARALELYRGELLPGFHLPECEEFERWLDEERAAARERAAAAAWALARQYEGERNFTEAGALARRSVRYSWTDERVLRRTLGMLDRIGDRAGAVALYDEFARRLRAELDVAPSTETESLVAELRASSPGAIRPVS